MVTIKCTVCMLDAKSRKIGEELLKAGVSFRDVAEWANWWRQKNGGHPTSKSAWGRHKVEGHFQFKERTVTMDGEVLDLDEYVDQMWADYARANKGKVHQTNEVLKWIELRFKYRGELARREEEKRVRALVESAAPDEEEDANAVPEGDSGGLGRDGPGPEPTHSD